MSEAARLLRYLIPGGTFLLIFGGWLYFDAIYYNYPWGRLSPDSSVAAAALLAGAALPIGFLISVLAAEMRWMGRPGRGIAFQWIDDQHLSQLVRTPATDTADGVRLFGQGEREVVITTFRVDVRRDSEGQAVSQRLQSLLDLMNALANFATAIVLACVTIVLVGIVSSWRFCSNCEPNCGRIVAMICVLLVSFLCLWPVVRSQRRVARLADGYARMLVGLPLPGSNPRTQPSE